MQYCLDLETKLNLPHSVTHILSVGGLVLHQFSDIFMET